MIGNSLTLFFRKLLIFHQLKIDIKICVESFFSWEFFTTFYRDLIFDLLILHCNDFLFRYNSLHCLKTVNFHIHSDFQSRISWCYLAEIMVFSNKEKAVIKNDFLQRGWNAYKICKEYPTKSWKRVSIYRLLKLFQEDNYMDRRAGSGRQQTITIEEYQNLIYIYGILHSRNLWSSYRKLTWVGLRPLNSVQTL